MLLNRLQVQKKTLALRAAHYPAQTRAAMFCAPSSARVKAVCFLASKRVTYNSAVRTELGKTKDVITR